MSYQPIWDGRSGYGGKSRRGGIWKALLALVLLGAVCFAALEGVVLAHSGGGVTGQPEVMIILGCQVKSYGPSETLVNRMNAALSYLEDHPDMTIVASGGQGQDEPMSEAQCIYDYLTAHGVNGEQILLEDRSLNTWQNIHNSREVLRANGVESGAVLVVSNSFHLARVKLLWPRAWEGAYTLSTLGVPVTHKPTAVAMFFREPLALVKSFVLDR